MKNFFILCSLLIGSEICYSQRNANWYFGSGAGMLFVNNTVQSPNISSTAVYDNSSSMSDANGSLLFYCDGLNVFNSQHQVMANGSGLLGNFTAGQCALIVPIPCSATRYAVFYPTEFASPGYLRYSYVNMAQNNGLGAVEAVGKNSSLGTNFTEKLCAYYNAQGNFYWVVTHKWNSADFVAIRLDATGVTTTSVVSTVGSVHNCGVYSGAHDAMGQLTISQDGTKLANALTCSDIIELFDFNVVTGQVSNPVQLVSDGGNAWGTVFSPDSKMLYTNSIFTGGIYQFDLSSGVPAAIQNSRNKIGESNLGGYSYGYMELAADNKIYFSRPNTNTMGAINSPNTYGTACNFSLSQFQLTNAGTVRWGISRIAYNIPALPNGSIPYTISSPTFCAGQTVTVNITNGSGIYLWNQIQGGPTMTFAPNSATTVTVSAIVGCQSQTIALVPASKNSVEWAIQASPICIGQTATITAFGNAPFLWNGVQGASQYTFVVGATNTIVVTKPSACLASTLNLQGVNCKTGINENQLSKLSVVPNPVNDVLSIMCSGNCASNFTIYNMLGKIVAKGKGIEWSNKVELDLAALPAGTYLLQLDGGVSLKFVKL